MKKNIFIELIFALCASLCVSVLASCADADGLHNQKAAQVTFVFENFPEGVSGDYSIPGNFNDWDNTQMMVSMSKGNGTSNPVMIAEANIQFSLVKVNDWLRGWNSQIDGNGFDNKDQKYHNFYIDDLDLASGEITVVIDGTRSGSADMVYAK